jgi:hypothetical protein
MAVWMKLTLTVMAGSAGLLTVLRRTPASKAVLEQTIRQELEGLRDHLFSRR